MPVLAAVANPPPPQEPVESLEWVEMERWKWSSMAAEDEDKVACAAEEEEEEGNGG
jgi:hypothetical protein